MKKNFFQLTRNSFFYFLANLIASFIGVITLPLYTRFLTPDDYGITAIAASLTGFLSAFYTLGLMAAFGRFYFDYQKDQKEVKKHISTITLFLAIYGLAFTLFIISAKRLVENITGGIPFYPYIILAIVSSYIGIFLQIRLNLCQIQRRAKHYLALYLASTLVSTCLIIFWVVIKKQGALGYIKAGLISHLVFAVFSLWSLRSYLIPAVIDFKKLRVSLRYSLPLIPHLLAGWALALADRLILNSFVSTTETGLYSAGYKIANIMGLLATSINFAWAPYFFAAMKERGNSAKKEIVRFATYWVAAMFFVFLFLTIFSKEIIIMLTASQYHQAYKVVPLIALASLFSGLYYVVVNPLFWKNKTFFVSSATISAALLNVGLNFLLIPRMQMTGAALATLVSLIYCFVFVAYFSIKYLPLPYEYVRLLKTLIASTVCYLAWLIVPASGNLWLSVLIKLPIVLSFPLWLLLFNFFKKEELAFIKKTLNQTRQVLSRVVYKK